MDIWVVKYKMTFKSLIFTGNSQYVCPVENGAEGLSCVFDWRKAGGAPGGSRPGAARLSLQGDDFLAAANGILKGFGRLAVFTYRDTVYLRFQP